MKKYNISQRTRVRTIKRERVSGLSLTFRRAWYADDGDQDAPAVAENTETMIPKSRFDEINTRRKQAEEALEKLRSDQQKASDEALAEQERWRELAEQRGSRIAELESKATEADELRASLVQTVEARIESLPENVRDIVPQFDDPRQTLAWLDKAGPMFAQPVAPNLDAGAGGGSPSSGNTPKLSAEETAFAKSLGMTPEQYAAARHE